MLEKYWKILLKKIEKEYDKELLEIENDMIFIEGINKLDVFLEMILEDDDKPLERHQFDCLIDFMPIILPWTFGMNYWKNNKIIIMINCNLKHDKNCVLTVIKRQHGKTELLVRVVTASAVAFPNIDNDMKPAEWCIVSHKGDHAKEILRRCETYLSSKKEFIKDFITEERKIKTLKKIEIIHKYNKNDKRIIEVFEGNIDGLAGKRLFGDEFFKWLQDRADVQYPPQLQVKGTSALLFTTLKGRSHWSERWLQRGFKLMHIINYGEICIKCLDLPYDEAIKCKHMPKIQAHFINPEAREAIIYLMNPRDALTQMYNIVPNSQGQVWQINYLKKKIMRYNEEYFREYFAFVDPSMTSEDGSYSATSIIGENNDGEDTLCFSNSELTSSNTHIVNFIEKDLEYFVNNFSHPKRKKYIIFLFVEHNTVNHELEIWKRLSNNGLLKNKIIFVRGIKENKQTKEFGRFGVRKGKNDEEFYAQTLGDKMLKNQIYIHEKFITRSKLGTKEIINTLITQCSHVRTIPYGNNKVKISSTLNLCDKRVNNDVYMSFVSALYKTFILKNPTHIAFNKQYRSRTPISKIKPKSSFFQ